MLTADTITADTITDEQIRELRDRYSYDPPGDYGVYRDCQVALGEAPEASVPGAKSRARTRCAEILNTRLTAELTGGQWYAPSEVRRKARARCADILNARAKESR